MPITINSKKDLKFAGKWLANTFQGEPFLTRKRKIAKLEQEILTLQNSTSAQELAREQKEREKLTNLLNKTGELLGFKIKNLTDLRDLLNGRTLKELVSENQKLKNTEEQKTITNLENKLADSKGELKKNQKEKESLFTTNQKLTDQIQTANYQIEGLIKNIERGILKKEKEILTQVKIIQSLLEDKK